MKLIAFFMKHSTRFLVAAVLVGIFAGISSAMLMAVINSRLSGAPVARWNSAWSFSVLVLMVLLTNFTSRLVMSRLSQSALFNLRLQLSQLIVASPLRDIEHAGLHRVLVALTNDIEYIARVFQAIPVTFIDIAMLLAGFVYLIWLSLPIFIILMVFLVLAVFTSKIPEFKAERAYGRARNHWEAIVGYFRAVTDGLKELKLHSARRQAFFSGPMQNSLGSYRGLRLEGDQFYAFAKAWGIIMYFVFVGMALYVLPKLGLSSPQILFGYIFTILYLKTPLDRVQDTVPIYVDGRIAMQRIQALGLSMHQIAGSLASVGRNDKPAARRETNAGTVARPLQPSFHEIELFGITHKYYRENEEREFELGPISLTINSGELIFLVGGNGSGKTTLAKLLTGLYIPESGHISFDGHPITDAEREWYSQHFAVVFSDFYLFESLLGLETPARDLDSRARDYLLQLQLDHKVQVSEGILSTTKLSQGQRKRLALLTAFLEDRPIYLFDEWAADQDPSFKKVFYYELLPDLKARGKTVIVISHDDHFYGMADRIIKLDSGKLDRTEFPSELPSVENATAEPALSATNGCR